MRTVNDEFNRNELSDTRIYSRRNIFLIKFIWGGTYMLQIGKN